MFYVSEILTTAPSDFETPLRKRVYTALDELGIAFERVDTDEAITMEDCAAINDRLDMRMVKTLFLCDRKQTEFYLFITQGDKPFSSKNFSHALGVSRVSFAPAELMQSMLGTKIGAATVFSALLDTENKVKIVIDKAVLSEEYYGCSDGITTGYMKLPTAAVVGKFLDFADHKPIITEV